MTTLIKQLIAPVGSGWIALAVMTFFAWRGNNRRLAIALSTLTLLLTMLGNGLVAAALMSTLAARNSLSNLMEVSELDAILVLGGGVSTTNGGEPFLNSSGDRTRVAAELFHSSRVSTVVVSGGEEDDPRAPMHVGREIFVSLGLPRDRVDAIPGRHTAAELAAFRELTEARGWKSVAICSDWWHLRRVESWIQREQFDAILVAAGGSSDMPEFNWRYHLIPQASALASTGRVIQEQMGALVSALGLR